MVQKPAQDGSRLSSDPRYRTGIDLFNKGEYFEAHEVLEEIWTSCRGQDRYFLQALIHYAVAFHHERSNNREGARLQLQKGLRKLAGYLPRHQDLDTAGLYAEGQDALRRWMTGETAARSRMVITTREP